MLTEDGKATARDCISRSGLCEPAGPLVITSTPNTSVARHSPELVCSNPATKINYNLTSQEQLSYNSEVRITVRPTFLLTLLQQFSLFPKLGMLK